MLKKKILNPGLATWNVGLTRLPWVANTPRTNTSSPRSDTWVVARKICCCAFTLPTLVMHRGSMNEVGGNRGRVKSPIPTLTYKTRIWDTNVGRYHRHDFRTLFKRTRIKWAIASFFFWLLIGRHAELFGPAGSKFHHQTRLPRKSAIKWLWVDF